MNNAYRNALAEVGSQLVRYIGLVDEDGVELAGGGYTRLAVSWTRTSIGVIRPTEDLTFSIPAGATVAGWSGHSDAVGGTDYGGAGLDPETFAGQGEYRLVAAQTGISHKDA